MVLLPNQFCVMFSWFLSLVDGFTLEVTNPEITTVKV